MAHSVARDTHSSSGSVGGNTHIGLIPVSFSRLGVPPTDLPAGFAPNFVRHFFLGARTTIPEQLQVGQLFSSPFGQPLGGPLGRNGRRPWLQLQGAGWRSCQQSLPVLAVHAKCLPGPARQMPHGSSSGCQSGSKQVSRWNASQNLSQSWLGLSSGPWRTSEVWLISMTFFPPPFRPPRSTSWYQSSI